MPNSLASLFEKKMGSMLDSQAIKKAVGLLPHGFFFSYTK